MKELLKIIGLTILFFTQSIVSKGYGSVGVALSTSTNGTYKNGKSLVLTGGMKMEHILSNLVIEGEGSYTIFSLEQIFNARKVDRYGVKVDILNLGVYVGYIVNLKRSDITIKPRIGINYANVDRADKSKIDGQFAVSFGVGGFYPLTDTIKLYLNFIDKGENNNYTGGFQFSF